MYQSVSATLSAWIGRPGQAGRRHVVVFGVDVAADDPAPRGRTSRTGYGRYPRIHRREVPTCERAAAGLGDRIVVLEEVHQAERNRGGAG